MQANKLSSFMRIGTLVKRKEGEYVGCGGLGLVVKRYRTGMPPHECAEVYWFNSRSVHGIGCGRLEVLNAA